MATTQPSSGTTRQHRDRAAFLRDRAAHFKSQGDDESLNYAADLECEADEIDALLRAGAPDDERAEAPAA